MKTKFLASLLRLAGFAAALVCVPNFLAAMDAAPGDAAAQLLAVNGMLPVQAAGPYVERGTFRIQVSTKLGRPSLVLDNDTWLYHNHRVDGSMARGTLVVRFAKGRVNELAVVTPAVVAALRDAQQNRAANELLAKK